MAATVLVMSTCHSIVAQANTLWDKLSCEDHLKLFARIRGVPGKETYQLVETALDQLELRPHAKKLAERLSGGMKRMGCVGCCCMLKKDKYEDDGVTCSNTGDACMCWFCEP